MLYHLKIILRNLFQNGLYSVINIAGLAISLAAVILIMLWVNDELSYDKFHKRSKDIYVAVASFDRGGEQYNTPVASPPMANAGKTEIPEVENACRIHEYWSVEFLQHNENTLSNVRCAMMDSSFFSIFSFELKDGDVRTLLSDNYSVVLSERVVKVLFGDEDPIGKTIVDDSRRNFHVTGIIADMPQHSSNRYDAIFAFSLFESLNPKLNEWWGNLNYKTYFLLKTDADAETVAQKLTGIHRSNSEWELTYSLLPLEKQNLHNWDGSANTKLQACRLFSTAVGVLLLIACINYINLVTSRASRRNKEIFVRNVMGARKRNLFAHFFNESLLLFLCSLIIATLLIYLLFPVYDQITGKQLEFRLLSASTMMIYGLAFVATSLFAGVYPALRLSYGANVQKASGGRSRANAFIRQTLVVLQFSASVVLILAAITVNRQMHFIKTMHPGYDKEHVFYVKLSDNMRRNMNDIKTRLMQTPGIEGVTFTSQNLSSVTQFNAGVTWEGKEEDSKITFTILNVDKDFIPVMNVKLTEGHNFTGMPSDSAYFIVNRTAVKAMDMQDPVGKRIMGYVRTGQIIGVTEDFHFQNMHESVKPLLMTVNPWMHEMYVKTGANSVSNALKAVENVYKQYNSEIPFEYSFVDDEFDRVYKSDIRSGRLFNVFSVIAIFISCLGLFGLVAYTAETKTKEIGIRKVLGASVSNIISMLSKEFLILVGIAMLIAFPLAYYWLNRMLQDYAYRITVGWWIFALAGLIIVVLTLLTVGWQAVKAATANPVKAIKSE